MSGEPAHQRREIHYRGRVQGVGFRYTVRHLAGRFPVTGFVKNLSDGRVQLVAEGTADALDRFLAAIDADMGLYIADRRETTRPASGRFQDFEIRF